MKRKPEIFFNFVIELSFVCLRNVRAQRIVKLYLHAICVEWREGRGEATLCSMFNVHTSTYLLLLLTLLSFFYLISSVLVPCLMTHMVIQRSQLKTLLILRIWPAHTTKHILIIEYYFVMELE